jgi:hypothetical protein
MTPPLYARDSPVITGESLEQHRCMTSVYYAHLNTNKAMITYGLEMRKEMRKEKS